MSDWQPIETAPKDGTLLLLANYDATCLLTGAPHVWTGRYVDIEGEEPRIYECSYAATNENGDPTHWMPLPEPPATGSTDDGSTTSDRGATSESSTPTTAHKGGA